MQLTNISLTVLAVCRTVLFKISLRNAPCNIQEPEQEAKLTESEQPIDYT